MTNKVFFSVIIPTFNRAKFIRQTIESVLAQTFEEFEIIVVDDGSTDNTNEVVKVIQDDRIRYFKKENAERAAARNYGASVSNGLYVNFLDSDDLLYPNHLKVAHEFCSKNNGVEIFHLGYDVKDDKGNLLRSETGIQDINRKIVFGNMLSCNGVFIRKDILLENRFNEDRPLSTLEDWELWIRMSSRYKFVNSNQLTSAIILHDERSVVSGDSTKLKLKADHFIKHVSEDEMNRKVYAAQFRIIFSSVYMYTALHLAMMKANVKEVLNYLVSGIQYDARSIFTKRFLVILKLLIVLRFKN